MKRGGKWGIITVLLVLVCFGLILSVYVFSLIPTSRSDPLRPHKVFELGATRPKGPPPNTSDDCLFFATQPKPSSFPRSAFPYPSHTFNSHLIDMVYMQNKDFRLIHGEGWNRTLKLLQICQRDGVVLFSSTDKIFHEPMVYVASWLRAYGCRSVETYRSGVDMSVVGGKVWVAVGIYIPKTYGFWGNLISYENLILVQTEQLTSSKWTRELQPTFIKCKETPSCVIWDFSEANYKNSLLQYQVLLPMVILPITLRSTPILKSVPSLQGRPYGYIFYGSRNERRKEILKTLPTQLVPWDGPQCDEAYQFARFCISLHYYHSDSGLEYHRLAQHVKTGCLPVYETPGDSSTIEFFEYHKTLKFVEEEQFSEVVSRMNACIDKKHTIMQEQQIFIIQWWSRELEAFEKVLKAFFYQYG